MSIDAKLVTVAENVPKVYAAGQKSVGMLETVTGNPAVQDYVHPTEHELDVKVTSKNLIPYPYAETTKTVNGITFTDNGDGTITANGTATAVADFYLSRSFDVKIGMVISGSDISASSSYQIQGYVDNTNMIATSSANSVPKTDFTTTLRIRIYAGVTLNNLVFKPQIEWGKTATPYTPHITEFDGVMVEQSGKNLFNKYDTNCLLNGYVSGAGAYMASSSGEKSFIFKCQPNTDYVISKVLSATNRVAGFSTIPSSGTTGKLLGEFNNTDTYTFNSGTAEYIIVWYLNNHGETVTNAEMLDSIQLEKGTTATPYEPYVEPTYHLAWNDGTVPGVLSASPTTILTADSDSVLVTAKYYLDAASKITDMEQTLLTLGGEL